MNGMGQRICWVSGGKVIFALGDGELFRDHALDGSAARDYAEGKAARSRQGKRLIELQGEFNPDEITEEDHRKYEAGKAEAEGASRRSSDDNDAGDRRAVKDTTATTVKQSATTSKNHQFKNGIKTRLSPLTKNTGSVRPSKMSFRGGRGGTRGGLKGATFDYDPLEKLESKPSALFPPHPNLKKPKPLTGKEKRQIKALKNLLEEIHRGPLYTEPTKRDIDAPAKTFSEDQFNSKYGAPGKAGIDPFHGVETYSQKYAPKKRTIPQLSGRPFNKELFPQELWEVLEGDAGEEVKNHINRIAEKKSLMLSNAKDSEEKTRIILEKIKTATGDKEDDAEMEDEEPAEEEEQDYDFEEDEDDMGGDYDGEKYFDNGEGDSGDDDNAGGDDY